MKICHVNEVLCLSFYYLNIPIHFNRQSVTKVPFMYNNAFARHSPVSSENRQTDMGRYEGNIVIGETFHH